MQVTKNNAWGQRAMRPGDNDECPGDNQQCIQLTKNNGKHKFKQLSYNTTKHASFVMRCHSNCKPHLVRTVNFFVPYLSIYSMA